MDATSTLQLLQSGAISADELVMNALAKIESENKQFNAATEILKDDAKRQVQNLPEGHCADCPSASKNAMPSQINRLDQGQRE